MTKTLIIIVVSAFVIASLSCQNVAHVATTETVSTSAAPATKLHLPQPWLDEMEGFYLIEQIEVRKAPNSADGEFLLRALPDGDNFYAHDVDENMPKPRYGKNMFAVNFTASPQVRTATEQEWESGSRIATKPRSVLYQGQDYASGEIEYRQQRYSKVGKYWGGGMLSPSGKWLAVFSYNGEKPPPSFFDFIGGGVPTVGDVFWQIYDTATGQKVFEWEAKNVKGPTHLDGPLIWLEDRYFLFPTDEPAQNFMVVTLPPVTPEVNPVMVQFPSRKDVAGQQLPAASRHEVWIPLVPLTKEQAAKLTAPYDTEIAELRLLGKPIPSELLLAIKEETENRRVNRGSQRDGSGQYHFKVVSTYYYAMSLADPAQTRFASKEEWDRAQTIISTRSTTPSDPVAETVKGTAPPYRQFPKTGATWGAPPLLGAGEWIAVFSYAQPEGKMFIDVYHQRLGDKLLSTALPFTGSPNELFKNALWIQSGYMMLPLNASLDSFACWRLPGGI